MCEIHGKTVKTDVLSSSNPSLNITPLKYALHIMSISDEASVASTAQSSSWSSLTSIPSNDERSDVLTDGNEVRMGKKRKSTGWGNDETRKSYKCLASLDVENTNEVKSARPRLHSKKEVPTFKQTTNKSEEDGCWGYFADFN